MNRLNGIVLPKKKSAANLETAAIEIPELVRIPMLMHQGTPCTPVVQPGDTVKVGQLIGSADAEDAVPIHASVSGTVSAISQYQIGRDSVPCIEIEPDGMQILSETCQPPLLKKREDLIAAAKNAGCVGLGGSGKPTHLKLAASSGFDMLILNGAECETDLSSDMRMMLEHGEDIVSGAEMIMKLMKIKETRISILSNQTEIIRHMMDLCEGKKGISICPLPVQYPQGAEKVAVYHTCGRLITEKQTAADVGVLLLNVSTCAFLYQYSQSGMPLVERVVTVSGDCVEHPCNLRVPVGTPAKVLLEYASCSFSALSELYRGGRMMGACLESSEEPILRQQNGLTAVRKQKKTTPSTCIRCGQCMRACPMHLMPMELEHAYRVQNIRMLQKYHVSLCLNCGSCSYVCPAKRPLCETNQLAIALLPKE